MKEKARETIVRETILDMIEEICGDEIVKEEPDIDLMEEGLKLSPAEFTMDQMKTPEKIIQAVGERLE